MQIQCVIAAVCVQVFMTLCLYLVLLKAKIQAYKEGKVDQDRVRIHMDGWPDKVVQINNNLTNQYQLPVLFYVLTVSAMALGYIDWPWVALSWGFVLSRVVHMIEHVGRNKVKVRMRAFIVGTVAVTSMVILLAYDVFSMSQG